MTEKEQAANARSRLTLDLSTRLSEELTRYADKQGISKAEALRNAIDLLMAANTAAEQGFTVGAWTGSDQARTERQFVGMGI